MTDFIKKHSHAIHIASEISLLGFLFYYINKKIPDNKSSERRIEHLENTIQTLEYKLSRTTARLEYIQKQLQERKQKPTSRTKSPKSIIRDDDFEVIRDIREEVLDAELEKELKDI